MRLFAALLLLAATAARGEVSFSNADFAVELDSDWVRLPVRFVQHVAFFSPSRNLTLKVDVVPAPLKRRTPQEAARITLDAAVKHAQEAEGLRVTDQSTAAWKNGGVMLTYAGVTQIAGRLRFVGLMTGDKFVYMQFETRAPSDRDLEAAVPAVLDRFRVVR